jgi:hypothetical protein
MKSSNMKNKLHTRLFGIAAFLLLFTLQSKAQYNTPAVNAAIAGGEYGTHANGQNQETNGAVVTYMTWDATNLYVGVTGGNVAEGYVLYLDSDPQIPVNGGTNANGTNVGFNYDGANFAALQFRANIVVYFKNGYREYRTHNGANGWNGPTAGFGAYADNGTNIREVAIPWTAVGGIPAAFNWFGYITSGGGFVYGQTPTTNAGGTIGLAARYERYYTVSTTTNGSSTKPFNRESYVFNSTVSNNAFGAITVYDFTMNAAGLQIARLNTGGDWVINGNLVINDGTIFFGSGGAGYGQTTVNNIDVRNVGSLNMDQTNKVLLVNGNASISSSSANALRLSGTLGGDLRLRGNFTKTAGTFNANGRQVDFNGTTAQSITSNSALSINFLLVSNTAANVTSTNAALSVVNNLTINAGANCRLDMGANALTLTGSAGNTVSGNLRSAGTITGATAGNLTFASGGQYEHNHSTTAGVIPAATWNANSTCAIIGYTTNIFEPGFGLAQNLGNFLWNCPSQTSTVNLAGTLTSVAGNFTMVSTGAGQVDLANTSGEDYALTIGGNFSQSGGTLVTQDLDQTFNTINIAGNFTLTGGTFRGIGLGSFGTTDITAGGFYSQSAGTFDFGAGPGSMLFKIAGAFTQSAGTINASTISAGTYKFEWNGTINQTITISGTIPAAAQISYRCNNPAGITLAAGTNLNIRDFMSFHRTIGLITGAGNINYVSSLSILEYDGTVAITTNDKEFPASGFRVVRVNNAGGVDLHAPRTFVSPSIMQILSGQLRLGANDLKIDFTLSGSITITGPTSNKMVVTNGAGQLIYKISTLAFPAAPLNYRFNVGDNTGGSEYTPIDFRFSNNTVAREIGVRVIDGISPNMNTPAAPADYLTRYWEITENAAGGTYRDSITVHYDVAGDVVGTQANFLVSDFNGATWNTFATTVSSPRCTTSVATTEITLPLNGAHITGRALTASPTAYVWNGSTSTDWNTNTNWTPNGIPSAIDDATIGISAPNPCTVSLGTVSINNLTLNGSGILNLSAATTLNIGGTFTYVATASANFNCTSNVNFTSASPQTIPAINYGNLNLIGGARTLANTGSIGICGNYVPSAGVTTTTGSTVNFNGTAAQAINTNAATFNNIIVSNTTANVTSNVVTTVTGIFTINANARYDQASTFQLTLSAASTTNVSGFLRNSSNLNITAVGAIINFLAGGAYEHNHTTTLLTIPTANWNATSTCIIMGTPIGGTPGGIGQTFGNFTVNFTGAANLSAGGSLTTINGNLSVLGTGTGSFRLTAGTTATVNIAGNLLVSAGTLTVSTGAGVITLNVAGNTTVSGGILDLGSAAASSTLNIAGSFSHTAGSITETGLGSANLLQFNGTLNQALNFGGTIANTVFYRFTNPAGFTLTGTLTVNTAASLTLNQGAFSGAGVIAYNAVATTLIYDGNAAISSSNYEWPTVNRPLNITLNGGASLQVDLHAARGMTNGTLTLALGVLNLGNFDLTIPTTATLSVASPGSNKMIGTGGTGFLVLGIATGASSVFYPIGDLTAGNEYTPTTLTFTANSIARNVGARVLDGNSPNLNTPIAATHYLSRYWLFSENAAGGTYAYTPAFTYNPGGDVNGTESQLKVANFIAGNWTSSATTVASPTITGTTSLTQATAPLIGAEFTGRESGTSYVWNGVTSTDWNIATNWTPNGNPGALDDVTINVQVPNACILPAGSVTVSSLTLNGTGNLQLAAGTSLTVSGSFIHGGSATATFDCSSTFILSSAGAITIPAFNYGNLNITGGARTFANSGTIGICQTFTPGAGPFTNTGSTIDYNGTGVQTISACNYNNLTISQARAANNVTLVNGGTIQVAGVFSPTLTFTSGIVVVTGNTFNFNGAAGQVMPAFWYNNITNTTNTTRTWANTGIIDIKGTFTPSTAVNTITGSTVRYSATTTGFTLVNVNSNVALRSYNNLTFDGVGGGWSSGAVPLRITGNLSVTNGTLNIGTASAGVLIVDQNTTINGGVLNLTTAAGTGTATLAGAVLVSSGTFNLATTGNGTVTLTGTGLSQTGGTISRTSGAAIININKPGLVYSLSQTGGAMTGLFTILPVAATSTTARLTSNFNIGPNAIFSVPTGTFLDCSTFVLNGNQLTIANGGSLFTANPDGITLTPTASGSVQTTLRTYAASCLFHYDGTVAQVTGNGLPATVDRLFVANATAGGVTLSTAVTVASEVNLGGLLFINNNNLNLGNACVFNTLPAGPLNASNMIVTNGTGKVFKSFNAIGSFTWPLGDNTGVTEYSPVTLNFSAMTVLPGSIGISVVNARHPQDATVANYLNRYWSFGTTSLSTYTYTGTFTYTAADVVGSAALLKFNRWDNTTPAWHQDAGSTSAGNTLTTTVGLTQLVTSGLLNSVDVTGRVDLPMYFRTVASGPWSTPGTWEVSSDPAFLAPAPVPAGVVPNSGNSAGIQIRNTHNVTVTANVVADDLVIDLGGTLTINTGITLAIANGVAATDMSVSGTIINAGAITSTGVSIVNATGVYDHNQNGGNILTATWSVGSLCRATGITNGVPGSLGQSFHHFEWACSGQTTAVALVGALTTVNGNFTVSNSGSPSRDLRIFANTTTGTLNIGGNLNITGGTFALINSGSTSTGVGTVNVAGNVIISGGSLDMSGSAAFTATSSNLFVRGDFSVSATGQVIRTQATPSTITFNKAVGLQTFTATAAGTNLSTITWRIGNGVTTPTVALGSNIEIGSAAIMNVLAGARLNCGTFYVQGNAGVGASFTLAANGNLGIGSVVGIAASPAMTGNIRTLTARTFNTTSNYFYNGAGNQITGTGLPATVANLTIENTGGGGNNIVTNTRAGATIVSNTFLLTAGEFFTGSTNTITLSNLGSFTNNGGSLSTTGAGGQNGGTINFAGAGNLNGSSSTTFYNVTINSGAVANSTMPFINGTLRINGGNLTSAPTYNAGSTLFYNFSYGRFVEWNYSGIGTLGVDAGYPNNVTVNVGTFDIYNGAIGVTRALAGNLSITLGATLNMGAMNAPFIVGGNASIGGTLTLGAFGGDLEVKGDWTRTGTFNPNTRLVTLNGTAAQQLTGTTTFDYLQINNASGLTLNNAVTVNSDLNLNVGNITLGNNNLVLGTATITNGSASSYVLTNGTGILSRNVGAAARVYPVGTSGSFAPATLTQNGTTENLNVRVGATITNAVSDATKIVNLQWNIGESFAGANNISSVFQWNTSDEAGAFNRVLPVFQGHWTVSAPYALRTSTVGGANPWTSTSTQTYNATLSNTAFVVGNLDGLVGCIATQANGDWNTPGTWAGNSLPPPTAKICISHNVTINVVDPSNVGEISISGTGSLNIASGRTLSILSAGFIDNSGGTTSVGNGKIIFLGAGSIQGSTASTIENLTLNGATTLTTIPTLNGTLQLNAGSFVTASPIYGGASTLVYNTGGAYGVSNEWIGATTVAGSGTPNNVTIQNNTAVNMPNSDRGMSGNLNISSGALNLDAVSGDLSLAGNWTRDPLASFTNNNRAVFFRGANPQTISITGGGTESFAYLVIDKSANNVILNSTPATNVNITGNAGNVLQFINTGSLDLNGQTLNLNNAGGSILTNGARNIIGGANSLLAINASKSVSSITFGTLTFGSNVTVALSAGMDFANNISTINGTLQIANGGFVNTNAPNYAVGSTLRYFSGTNYGRGQEWSATAGPGYPYNVSIDFNGTPTTLDMSINGNAYREIAGDLFINNGGILNMNTMSNVLQILGNVSIGSGASGTLTLSSVIGGDIAIGGNLTRNFGATLTQNGREVTMNGLGNTQNISSNIVAFDYLKIDNNGGAVIINANTVVNNRLWLNQGLFDNAVNTLTLSNNAQLRRSSSTSTMVNSPVLAGADLYDLQYDASMITLNEWRVCASCVRDVSIMAGTLTMGGSRSLNRHLNLAGDLDLAGFTLSLKGKNAAPATAGNIEITSGNRTVTGTPGSIFDIVGLNANTPADFTKTVTNPGAGTLTFGVDVLVRIGDGRMDWGAGNPTTINGVLQVMLGGSVFPNSCYYAIGSTLRFANTVDYGIPATDKTWASGAIYSGSPGIPYHVDVFDNGTDLQLSDTRALRGNLTITNGTFSLMPAYTGNFSIGGNWTRSGASSAFVHNNKKVVFDGANAQSITCTASSNIETFYDLDISPSGGFDVTQGGVTNIVVLNELTLTSGKLDLNNNEITLGTVGNNGTLMGGGATNYVVSTSATAKFNRYTTTTATVYNFPLGDATGYTPIAIDLYAGSSINANSRLSAYMIVGAHPNLGTSTNFINRYWNIEPTAYGANASYGVSYTYKDADVTGLEPNLKPVKYNPSGWVAAQGSGAIFEMGAGSVNPGTNTVSWSGLYTFSDFTSSGNGTTSPLPITLIEFTATPIVNTVELSWTTATEINNDYFTLERSADGQKFEPIQVLDGAGNSNDWLYYKWVDRSPLAGISYYRLKQTDFDGTTSISDIRMVNFGGASSENQGWVNIYPNPAPNGQFNVRLGEMINEEISMTITNILGEVIYNAQYTASSNQTLNINTEGIAKGVYTITINDGNKIFSQRIILGKE